MLKDPSWARFQLRPKACFIPMFFWLVFCLGIEPVAASDFFLSPEGTTIVLHDDGMVISDPSKASEAVLSTPLKAETLSTGLRLKYRSFLQHSSGTKTEFGSAEYLVTTLPIQTGEQIVTVEYTISNSLGHFKRDVMRISWPANITRVEFEPKDFQRFLLLHQSEISQIYSRQAENVNLNDVAVTEYLNGLANLLKNNFIAWISFLIDYRTQVAGKSFSQIPQDPTRYIELTASLVSQDDERKGIVSKQSFGLTKEPLTVTPSNGPPAKALPDTTVANIARILSSSQPAPIKVLPIASLKAKKVLPDGSLQPMTDKEVVDAFESAAAQQRTAYEKLKQKREETERTTHIEYVLHEGKAGDVRNWQQLKRGMEKEEVESILGEPERKDQTSETSFKYDGWIYPKGKVYFYKKKLSKWDSPTPKRVANSV